MPHQESQKRVEELRVGQELPTPEGRTMILKVGRVHPAGPGSYAWREVIRTLGHNEYHPFVVHRAVYQGKEPLQNAPLAGRWVFDSGDYCQSIEQALEVFTRREQGATLTFQVT